MEQTVQRGCTNVPYNEFISDSFVFILRHSMKICLIVSGVLMNYRKIDVCPVIRYLCVRLACPILDLFIIVYSLRGSEWSCPLRRVVYFITQVYCYLLESYLTGIIGVCLDLFVVLRLDMSWYFIVSQVLWLLIFRYFIYYFNSTNTIKINIINTSLLKEPTPEY